MSEITVNRQGKVPLYLTVENGTGGVAGLLCTAQIVDVETAERLDWSDLTFKAVGLVTPSLVLSDLGGGLYLGSLDLSTVVNLPAGDHLVALFQSQGAVNGLASDLITLVRHVWDDENADAGVTMRRAMQEVRSGIAGKINRSGNVYAYRDTLDSQDLFRLEDNDTSRDPV